MNATLAVQTAPVAPTDPVACESCFPSTRQPASSPWGGVQTAIEVAAGVWRVHTASHGGIHLSPERNAVVADYLRVDDGWYEEDIVVAAVFLSFPHLFPLGHHQSALDALRNTQPAAYERFTGARLAPGDSIQRDQDLFWEQNPEAWTCGSAFGDWSAWVEPGCVGVIAYRGAPGTDLHRRTPRRYFMIPGGAYRPNCPVGFVIEEAIHRRVPEPDRLHARRP